MGEEEVEEARVWEKEGSWEKINQNEKCMKRLMNGKSLFYKLIIRHNYLKAFEQRQSTWMDNPTPRSHELLNKIISARHEISPYKLLI